MKKVLACLLVLILTICVLNVSAEETGIPERDMDRLIIGHTTTLNGNFFGIMFGNNTVDLDVQRVLHGYDLVTWDVEKGGFRMNDTVVSGTSVTENEVGDRTYTLALYRDLKYSDGSPITAWDFAFSILLSASPEMAAIGAALDAEKCIVGIEEYMNGDKNTISGVKVIGDYLMSVTIRHEYRPFFYEPGFLSIHPYPVNVIAPGCIVADDGEGIYIVNREAFTADLLQETLLNPDTGYVSHPTLVTGPYRLISFDGETAELEINPYYKGNEEGIVPSISRLTFRLVRNENMMEELQEGSVDLINKCVYNTVIDQGLEMIQNGNFSMDSYVRNGFAYINFCCERPTVNEPAVRQAIAYCLDKDNVVTDYVGNYGVRVDGYYGIGQWMYQLISGAQAYPLDPPAENASKQDAQAYEDAMKAWEEMNLDGLKIYNLDLERANQLLDDAGWTLNEAGEKFTGKEGEIRSKEVDGKLISLDLKMIYPSTNNMGEIFEERFVKNLEKVGIRLTVVPMDMQDLLRQHYRQDKRSCDMIFLATNFALVFDPSLNYAADTVESNYYNTNGVEDERLYQLAVDMRRTEPGDLLTYCQKWVAFQEYWTEVLPAIPIYSNAYFDFYTSYLQEYDINASITCGDALIGAYIGEPEEEIPDDLEDMEEYDDDLFEFFD